MSWEDKRFDQDSNPEAGEGFCVFVFLPVYYYLLSYAVAQIAMILNELETWNSAQ